MKGGDVPAVATPFPDPLIARYFDIVGPESGLGRNADPERFWQS
ncbi:hypothetical protein [Sphingosinicella sp. CPCC 101087]|nr:hypothetical protein [Sphingosinicella sp. CPCC 101087]